MKKKRTKKSSEYWLFPAATRALEIALYYGFTPAEPVTIEKADRDHAKSFISEAATCIKPEEKAALLRQWFGKNIPQSPVSLATLHGDHRHSKTLTYTLDILGTQRSIADATLLKTAFEIIRSEGYEDLVLELNTIGDRESFARYTRELGNYYRKHMNELNPECRQAIKKDIFVELTCTHDECKTARDHVPYPMNYLSEPSRTYFMELLEILETCNLPYTINNSLLANRECAMHSIFRITRNDGKKTDVLAEGCRWGLIAKKMGLKKDVLGVSVSIFIKKPEKQVKTLKVRKPQCYFIQMGQEAKLKSLRVIEVLRQSKIPVYHSLTKDKLTVQLMSAESLKVPYILIMGQKESLENTILIREMNNRSQETVKIDDVGTYLKKVIG